MKNDDIQIAKAYIGSIAGSLAKISKQTNTRTIRTQLINAYKVGGWSRMQKVISRILRKAGWTR